jgi:hypothetical protein
MALVLMGLVHDPQAFRGESGRKLLGDHIGDAHWAGLASGPARGQCRRVTTPTHPGAHAAGLRRNEFVKLAEYVATSA